MSNPVARRRRRRSVRANPHRRRHFRRNPGFGGARGIVGTIKEGAIDGLSVLGGEIVQNKVVTLADKFVPAFGTTAMMATARVGILNIGVATAIAIGVKKVLPGRARFVAAGAFARGFANVLATTPVAALLGDGVVYDDYRANMAAYPRELSPGMAAYPSPSTVDVPHSEH